MEPCSYVLYYNARNLIPKLDELCAPVEAHNPDIVSFVESWLCDEIPDGEIPIPSYQIFCKDRNRHGGGVLLYVKDTFSARVPSTPQHFNLEILPIIVQVIVSPSCDQYVFCSQLFTDPLI